MIVFSCSSWQTFPRYILYSIIWCQISVWSLSSANFQRACPWAVNDICGSLRMGQHGTTWNNNNKKKPWHWNSPFLTLLGNSNQSFNYKTDVLITISIHDSNTPSCLLNGAYFSPAWKLFSEIIKNICNLIIFKYQGYY